MDAVAESPGRWRARGAAKAPDAGPVSRQTPIERFLEPCLLVSLAQGPAHGYALKEHCETQCLVEEPIDVGTLYRALRRMERQGWVASAWVPAGPQRRRRVYRLIPLGEGALRSWALGLRRHGAIIDRFLRLYEGRFPAEAAASGGEGERCS